MAYHSDPVVAIAELQPVLAEMKRRDVARREGLAERVCDPAAAGSRHLLYFIGMKPGTNAF